MQEAGLDSYTVIAGGRYLEVRQNGANICFDCENQEFEAFWREYFDLNGDYEGYIRQIDAEDIYLKNAADLGAGIRILKQDLWEVIVTFLISQQNNIVRIKRCVQNICERYGEQKVTEGGKIYHAFPTPEALAVLEREQLDACNLGYRSKYVICCAKSVAQGCCDLEKIAAMHYEDAKAELLKLYGVGEKVAECICLFGLHHLQAFPIDTHIKQALDGNYGKGFPLERYRGFEGVMQQYIFYWELKNSAAKKKQTGKNETLKQNVKISAIKSFGKPVL